ncbi:7TM diverse intracellular signaling domain-containing protein [Aestuariirhabdus sp. LZHN29]|uniref:7TM diverse intracellular signaling domain-containing protein n=1 Tax=Aestuariirhabdus sp. LZHN29 TaxID=3417462 RepID=UPI003CF58858
MPTPLPKLSLGYLTTLFVVLTMTWLPPLQAAEQSPVAVDARSVIDIAPHLQYWRTNRGMLSIEQVERAYQRGLFNESLTIPFSLPRTRDGIWLRFMLAPQNSASLNRTLEFRRPFYDRLQVYAPTDDGYQRHSLGYDHFRNYQSPEPYHYRVPITLDSDDTRPYYIYLEDSLTIRVPVKLWQADALSIEDTQMTVFLTAIFTTMLVLALYNLSLFAILRDQNYLHYAVYMVALCMFLMTRETTLYQLSWLSLPDWGVQQLIFTACIAAAAAARFNQSFVNLAHYTPLLNKAIWVMIVFLLLVAALCTANIREFDSITASVHNWANFALAPLMVIASIIALQKGNRQARWFLAGWVFLLTATFIATLSALGFMEQSPITLYGIHVAAALEAIILSVGLADRINIIRRERDDAEQLSRDVDGRASNEKKRRHKSDAVAQYISSIHSRSSEQQVYGELVNTLANVLEIRRCALLHSNTGSIRVYSLNQQLEEFFSQEISGRLKLLEGVSSQGEAMMLQHRSQNAPDSDSSTLAVIPLYSWHREWSVILIEPESGQEFSQHQLRQASRFCGTIKEQILNYRRYRVTIDGTETEESGALTRTAFLKHAQRTMRQWNRHGEPLSIALWEFEENLLDLHPLDNEGQALLFKTMVQCCEKRMQRSNILGRYGNNELMLLLPGHDLISAENLCKSLYRDLRLQLTQQYDDRFNLALSIGIAAQSDPTDTLEKLTRNLTPLAVEAVDSRDDSLSTLA